MKRSHRDLLNDMAEHRPILKNNQTMHYSLIFQDRAMFSHTNGKLSPRPNDWAEHRPILKNQLNTYYPRFSFIPKTGIAFPKTGVSF